MAIPQDHDDELPRAALGWQLVLLRALASHAGALAVDALRVRRVCRAARVHPDDAWPTLDSDAVVRVAEALRSAPDA